MTSENNIIEELAYLYDNDGGILRLVREAGLSPSDINLRGTPHDIWSAVEAEAKKRDKWRDILELAAKGFSNRPILQNALKQTSNPVTQPGTATSSTATKGEGLEVFLPTGHSDKLSIEKTIDPQLTLVIKVVPRGESKTKLTVSALLHSNLTNSFIPLLLKETKETNTLTYEKEKLKERLPKLFKELVLKIQGDKLVGEKRFELLIEIFLPKELLDFEFEKCTYDSNWLGKTYPVVLRSYERISEGIDRKRWIDRWNYFKQTPKAKKLEDFACCTSLHGELLDIDNLHDELIDENNEEISCIVLASPLDMSNEESHKIYHALINSGIPVVLWPRRKLGDLETPEQTKTAQQVIDNLWNKSLALLPEKVMKCRTHARASNTDHPSHYLTLLWDDPNKIPPKEFFLTTRKI